MATIRMLLGIICLAFAGSFVNSGSGFLGFADWKVGKLKSWNVGKRTTIDEQRFFQQPYPFAFRSLPRWQQTFSLMKKYAKNQERMMLPPADHRMARRSFCPPLFGILHNRLLFCENVLSNIIRLQKTTNEQRKTSNYGQETNRKTKNQHPLNGNQQKVLHQWQQETDNRQLITDIAKSQLGIREATGKNDGIEVEKYLRYTGNKKGEAWCASFVSWVFAQAGHRQPRTAWSPALFPSGRHVPRAAPAMVFGIYFPKLKRIAHVGLVTKVSGNWVYTIEGNTNPAGSREGDGVYQRIRHTRNIAQYADWLNEKGGRP